ncbi:plasmid mobilization protein [Streptococcus suis]|uniref:plasmid mobilization protein n=1 Tax=Streptococcus suis TaxID=1307 RepID=UPI001F05EB6A|nr:transposase [Streptococcus suis]MCH1729698.1 transposase [Streptococcus suis]MCH1738585.1 transposase [Streptococcus suis]MCH1740498.1 transposase [Streptococcus suis]MCJ7475305.1 transposase [Streptococcus suis]MCJ7481199.1 transposase [Streptococcus suis]
MSERIRTILKKFYVTELQNEVLNQLVNDTGLQTFSNYACRMLFKETSLFIQFDDSQFDELIYSLRRIQNNLRQLSKIADQSQDSQAYRAMDYSRRLVSHYEKELTRYHKKKKRKLLSKGA